ncbi:alpha-ketoglutarate dehydrogenase component 4 isoform X4 [Aquarana catesbeiana]|uniref:alpha-ketoglutarate dehydrogenase component 4 isoform X4 n=1 Tax=Aquarana catesbeiana TaxID=8400 RepID=UPI003CC9853E
MSFLILYGANMVVKPHVPAIRFPDRKSSPKPNVTAQQATSENPPGISNPAPVRRVATSPDTNDLLKSLPQKYRRKPVSNEEMEYIQRGGPE